MTGMLKTAMIALLASTAFAGAPNQGTQFNSSVGRIVWGHPLELTQRTDQQEKPIFNDDGTPSMGIAFGLAIPKADFLANEWPHMASEATKGFPNGVPQNFSWKYKDGDTDKDSKGVPLSQKEGYAGCYILTIVSNTGYPPALYKFNGSSYDQLTAKDIKRGDYVSVAIKAILNMPTKATHTPSLYINPEAIEFVGYGKEIAVSGVNPMQAFGGRQHQLPPGASAMPVSPSAGGGVQMPGVGGGMPMGAGGGGGQMPGYPPQQPQQQYQQPPAQPQHAPQAAPGNPPMGMPMGVAPGAGPGGAYPVPQMQPGNGAYPSNQPVPGQMPPPAPDFIQHAGMQPQQPQGYPPQYQQPPAQQMPGYPPQQPQQGPSPLGYQMPGMMPGR